MKTKCRLNDCRTHPRSEAEASHRTLKPSTFLFANSLDPQAKPRLSAHTPLLAASQWLALETLLDHSSSSSRPLQRNQHKNTTPTTKNNTNPKKTPTTHNQKTQKNKKPKPFTINPGF